MEVTELDTNLMDSIRSFNYERFKQLLEVAKLTDFSFTGVLRLLDSLLECLEGKNAIIRSNTIVKPTLSVGAKGKSRLPIVAI